MTDRLHRTPIVFLDFDGTMSRGDAVDILLDAYADPAWLQVEREWLAGRIGSRECLRAQVALVRATREEMDALFDGLTLDRGVVPLLDACARHAVPVHIVSDGFDYGIQRMLRVAGLDDRCARRDVRVCASHLESRGHDRWHVTFPFFPRACAHACATCKPAVMRTLNGTGAPTVFVGDGLSDRYAALCADVVYAKDALGAYCRTRGIPYVAYTDLGDVAASLHEALQWERGYERPSTTHVRT